MSAKPHTFNDIFGSSFGEPGQQVKLKKILIPMIQRDYAQGRTDPETKRIRERFLGSLHDALTGLPLTLDFVYGDLDSNGVMTPLDGQQRLTTLFLLYWFAAKKEGIEPKDYAFLSNFSYETRYSSRDFCAKLVEFNPTFASASLSKEIVDQPWFPYDWEKDPTISSMLVMLDAIKDRFSDITDIWGKLLSGCINFYFLPIKNLGLTDDLYIKMNSTGKPLTLFEDFKAELEHSLSEVDAIKAKDLVSKIIFKIDQDWTDMLWTSKKTDDVIDDEFLRYFRFICDVISVRQDGGAPHDKGTDIFDLLEQYFSKRSKHLEDNIALLSSFFNCWCKLEQDEFFASIMANTHQEGKILVRDNLNILSDCRANYGDAIENGNRKFTLQRFILLYAVIYYLIHKASISFDDFKRRLRIVNNLIENSEDEIASRAARNNLPAILKQAEKIIGEGSIDDTLGPNFNSNQLAEEKEKIAWASVHPDLAESLFRLEDHPLLKGQISIVGLDHPEYFSRFEQLFPPKCSEERFDLIDCALMSIGNYGQRESNVWRWQFGSSRNSSAWENLFHRSKSDSTKDILRQLLGTDDLSDEGLRRIAQEFLDDCRMNHHFVWRYYYVAYKSFRPGRYGKYWIGREEPYSITTMLTQRNISETSRQAFLYEVGGEEHIDKDSNGKYLLYPGCRVKAENAAFVIESLGDEHKELGRIDFAQDESGVDTEDRIQRAKAELPGLIAKFQK